MLDYSIAGAVATITLNRPEVLNAFNDELGKRLLAAVSEASGDASVRCVVLTGSGRSFSSGEDLGALASAYEAGKPPDLSSIVRDRYNPLIRALRAAPKPVVAAVNGVAAGAGASVALACDVRIAAEEAKLLFPFAKVGLVPDSGATWMLTQIVGPARAWELAVSGRAIDANEALALGLIHEITPSDALMERCRAAAAELAAGPTVAYALTKKLIEDAGGRPLDEQLDAEAKAQGQAGATRDHVEGVRAFFSKRKPDFTGS